MSLSPPSEAIYASVDTAFTAIQAHAKASGYAFSRVTTRPSRVIFACDRAGKYDSRGKDSATDMSKRRKGTGSKKCGCLMKVELRQDRISMQWVVGVLEGAHNHPPSTAPTAHPAHRIAALTLAIRTEIGRLSHAGLSTNQILSTLRISNPSMTLIAKDIGNIVQQIRAEELNGRTPIQWLLEVRIKTSF
jgi:hypothetical protein